MNESLYSPIDSDDVARRALIESERDFHEKRWGELAAAQSKLFRFSKRATPADVMQEEAYRDDEDFEKRSSEEYEAWQKNLRTVITNFKERAQSGEGAHIKTLIVILGGGMKCAYSAGQIMGLSAMGLTADKVDTVVGASGGAVVATAYVGGSEQTRRTALMMAGPMSTEDFINPSMERFRSGTVINLGLLADAMNEPGGEYALDEKTIRKSDTELWYTVTLPTEGSENPEVEFLNAKDLPQMTDGIKASMSLHPKLTGPATAISGVEYRDGAINPLPIEELIKKFSPTDVLVLPQLPYEYINDVKPSAGEHAGSALAKLAGFNAVAKGLVSKREFRLALEQIQKIDDVNIGVLWPPDSGLSTIATDGDALMAGIIASYKDTFKQFEAGEPTELPFLGAASKDTKS